MGHFLKQESWKIFPFFGGNYIKINVTIKYILKKIIFLQKR